MFEGTTGIDNVQSHVECTGSVLKVGVSEDMLGRIFNGAGKPIDGRDKFSSVPVVPDDYLDVAGAFHFLIIITPHEVLSSCIPSSAVPIFQFSII